MNKPGDIVRFWSILPNRPSDPIGQESPAAVTPVASPVAEMLSELSPHLMYDPQAGSRPLLSSHFQSIPEDARPLPSDNLAQEATFRMPIIALPEDPAPLIDVGFEGVLPFAGKPVHFRVPSRDENVLNVVVAGYFNESEVAAIEELLAISAGTRTVSVTCEKPHFTMYKVRVRKRDGSEEIQQRYKVAFEGSTAKVDFRTYGRRRPDGTRDMSVYVTVHGSFVNEQAVRAVLEKRSRYPVNSIEFERDAEQAIQFRRDSNGTDIGLDAEVYWSEHDGAWVIDNVRGAYTIFYRTVGHEIIAVEPGTYVKITDGQVLTPANGHRWEALVDPTIGNPEGVHGSISVDGQTFDARFTMQSLSGKGAFVAAGAIESGSHKAIVEDRELTRDGAPTMIEDGMITVRWSDDAANGQSGWLVINYRSTALWYHPSDTRGVGAILPGGSIMIPDGSALLPDRDARDPQTWLHPREIRLKSR